ncbi:hypothetical protein BpHYR1_037901 [Brachionus plicatilis]|uniref:Uncharacterized protein n=1 Tax=Brachionus plicatilis TaxID=10195 RepID=A0A3M7T3L6_BRAPC|nr:hypothetical protein BpHYR1_037901 [Brachionus plicatilis]
MTEKRKQTKAVNEPFPLFSRNMQQTEAFVAPVSVSGPALQLVRVAGSAQGDNTPKIGSHLPQTTILHADQLLGCVLGHGRGLFGNGKITAKWYIVLLKMYMYFNLKLDVRSRSE